MSWTPSVGVQRLVVAAVVIVCCVFLLSQPGGEAKLKDFAVVIGPIVAFYFASSIGAGAKALSVGSSVKVGLILLSMLCAAGWVLSYAAFGLVWIVMLFGVAFVVAAGAFIVVLIFS